MGSMNIQMAEENFTSIHIKVIGIGGGGCNAINRMMEKKFPNIDFIALNTDVQALKSNQSGEKIQIGAQITRGLGAGANPETGKKAALESKESIKESLKGSDMVFITAGMGGGTGTGASPIVAQIAKEMGILTVAIVTKPFVHEGARRMKQANQGIEELEKYVDSLIIIPNQRLVDMVDDNLPFVEAFAKIDDILRQGIQGLVEIINKHGLVNVDFADVKAIMAGAGTAIMGIGFGTGKNRANDAVERAVNNPLLGLDMSGAKGILVNVSGSKDLALSEYNKIVSFITQKAHPEANIIVGASIDEALQDQLSVTVIATSFESINPNKQINEEDLKVATEKQVICKKEIKEIEPIKNNEQKFEEKKLETENEFINFNNNNTFYPQTKQAIYNKNEIDRLFSDDDGFSTLSFDDLEVPTFQRRASK